MKTHSLIFQWQRIVIPNHTAKHISGLILRKWWCYPRVKWVKMSRIRWNVRNCSWRAGEQFPGSMAAHRHCWENGEQRNWCTKVLCNDFHLLSHTARFGFVQIKTGCPYVVLLWSQLFIQALVTLSWSAIGAWCSSQLVSLHDVTLHDCGISPGHISFWPMQRGSSVLN